MYYSLAPLSSLCDGYKKVFNISGLALMLIQVEGQRFIIEDRCPHMDAKLSTGTISGTNIMCRAHGITFCLNSGKAQGPLAHTLDCLKDFPVVYDGNTVGVEL